MNEKFYIEIDYSKRSEFTDNYIIKNLNEFMTFLKNHNSSSKIYVANLSFVAYWLMNYFADNDIKVYQDTLRTYENLCNKVQNTTTRRAPVRLCRINCQYGRLFDLGSKVSHYAIIERHEFEKCFDKVNYIEQLSIDDNVSRMYRTPGAKIRHDITEYAPGLYKFNMKVLRDYKGQVLKSGYLNETFRPYYRGALSLFNERYKRKLLKNVCHIDITSDYIYQLKTKAFPASSPIHITKAEYFNIISRSSKQWLAQLRINISEVKTAVPYFSMPIGESLQYVTNLDFEQMKRSFEFTFEFIDGYFFNESSSLPEDFIDLMVNRYFKAKKELKEKKGTPEFNEQEYNFVKQIANIITGTLGKRNFVDYHYFNIFISIYLTAWARWELFNHIVLLGNDFIYSNCDSIFATSDIKSLVEGTELGNVEKEFIPEFIIAGRNKWIAIFGSDEDDEMNVRFETTIGGMNKNNTIKFIHDIGVFTFRDMFSAGEVYVPPEYNLGYTTYFNEDNSTYIRRKGYKL